VTQGIISDRLARAKLALRPILPPPERGTETLTLRRRRGLGGCLEVQPRMAWTCTCVPSAMASAIVSPRRKICTCW
jgi:hypothetical protein